jgi:hypothetical protein
MHISEQRLIENGMWISKLKQKKASFPLSLKIKEKKNTTTKLVYEKVVKLTSDIAKCLHLLSQLQILCM